MFEKYVEQKEDIYMNKIYKVVWSKARNCYVVASEFAKSHQTGSQRIKSASLAAVMAAVILMGFSGVTVQAAVTVDKDGIVKADAADISALNDLLKNGVTTNKDGSVTVGGLNVKNNGEVSIKENPNVVYGQGANINWDSNNTTGQISIGKNATVVPGRGGQETSFAYDGDYNHAAGAIAIGTNTYARTGSIMIGSHVYKGNMGDVTGIDTDTFNTSSNGAYGFTVNSTTIGTNSFTRGNLATTIGDYNIQSGKSMGYNDWKHWNPSSLHYGAQNFGATVIGALNSNESQSAPDPVDFFGTSTSGVANSIVGVANKVNSSNGTLVFGAGNEVTHSLSDISGVDDTTSLRDAKNAQDALKKAVAASDAGGAVLAIGGANKADWAQKSQLVGVGNTLTGTSNEVSKYDMINGYKNEVTNATNTSIIGSNNKANDVQATTVMGDNNDLTGNGNHVIGDNHKVNGKNNILIGNNKEQKTHSGSDSVIIGNNASAGNGSMVMGNKAHAGNTGIALGMNASAGDGQNLAIGYYANVSGAKNSTALGYASKVEKRDILASDGNDGVVSVGKSVGQSGEAGITRRVINVKEGVNDTDAVNVSQLKDVTLSAGDGISITDQKINVKLKNNEQNLAVNKDGLSLNNDITLGDTGSNTSVTITGSKGTIQASSSISTGNIIMDGHDHDITGLSNKALGGKDFAKAGRAATEEQLKLVADSAETANKGWNLSTNGKKATQVKPGDTVDFAGDNNITISNSDKNVSVKLNKEIDVNSVQTNALNSKYNLSVGTMAENGIMPFFVNSTGDFYAAHNKFHVDKDGKVTATAGEIGNVVLQNGVYYGHSTLQDGSLLLTDDNGNHSYIDAKSAKLGKVTVAEDGKITGVAAGKISADSTDAVNGSQLKKVETEAGKHSVVTEGANITVTPKQAEDGRMQYNVALKNDIKLAGDNDYTYVNISGSNGSVWASSSVAAGNVIMDGTTATVSGLGNTTTAYDGFANGEGKAATEEQLKEISKVADNANQGWNLSTNGGEASKVAPGETVDFSGDKNITISNDGTKVQVELNKKLKDIETISNGGATLTLGGFATELANGQGASVKLFRDTTTINNAVTVYKDGRIAGVADGVNANDAVNVSQLQKAAAESATTVSDGVNTTVTAAKAEDGHTDYKVNLNKDLVGIESISNGSASLTMSSNPIFGATAKLTNGKASVELLDSTTIINGKVQVRQDGSIGGVTAGRVDNDAVNLGQLKDVKAEALKHTTLSDGKNTTVAPTVKEDGQTDYKVNVAGDLTDITSVANDDAKLTLGGFATELANGQGASVKLFRDTTTINNAVTVYKDGRIAGVADGVNANDAVNVSQLQKAAAESATTVSDGVNTTVTAAKAEDGHTDYKVNLNKDLVGIESISNGDAKLTLGGFATELANGQGASVKLFRDTTTINNAVTVYKDGRIAGVAAGINDNDAVNVGQLKDYVAANDTHIKSGDYAVGEVTDSTGNKSQGVSMNIVNKAGKVTGTVTITDVAKASDVGDVNNIASDIKNKEGKTTVVDAVNNLNNKVGDLQYSKVEKGEIADGDSTTTAIGKLDQKLTDVAATAAKHTKVVNGSNITVEETAQDGQKTYKVGLNKDILLGDITGKNVSISGTNGTIETTGYIATKDRVYADKGAKLADVDITGDTISNDKSSVKLDKEGTVTINNKVTIDGNGKVSGVADGEISATSTDAVNGGQLYKTNQAIANNATNISSLSHSISNLDNRVNKVGAGAAALAALHPLDFDPDAKWDFAAGYGNYRGTNAAAVGAYYRPNEDTMFSVGGTFGNGENMVNAGVSFKLGSGSSHVSTSRVAMAKEIKELRGELEAMKSAMLDANAGKKIDTSKLQLFPDVPQNHWAYEYVTQLAGNGMIEGYPDGNFAGDRPMTRYEFAAILYRAMMKGAVLSDKILSEFSHELEYFTVDTVAKDKAGNPTIQRVRTVKENINK